MGIINVLDFSVANLIAAGEVVDRPGSVIKELLENAIDAGATKITVEVKRGGITFMRVTDNGCGMSREDVPTALRRHATSKIRSAQDLGSIFTLGFRGEALAAISAVSNVRIMTKRREDATGTLMEAVHGDVKSVTDAGCPDGTTVIVEDLFANVPARLKFLKRDITETAYILSNAEKIALSHPEISFRVIADGAMKLSTVGDGNEKNAIYSVLGKDFASKITEINGGVDGVDLHGFIGTPENTRANRNQQIFFINRRFIRSKTVSAALEQAYTSFIPADKFPCAVIYLEIHPSSVDVNVHPAKLECKFSNERLIFDTVYYSVRNALQNALEHPTFKISENEREKNRVRTDYINAFVPIDTESPAEKKIRRESENDGRLALEKFSQPAADEIAVPAPKEGPAQPTPEPPADVPAMPWTEPFAKENRVGEAIQKSRTEQPLAIPDLPKTEAPDLQTDGEKVSAQRTGYETFRIDIPFEDIPEVKLKTAVKEPIKTESEPQTIPKPYRILGELFSSYVIVERQDTAYIIDKHAAHERILFEQLRENTEGNQKKSQILLVPAQITLSAEEAVAAEEYKSELEKTGFGFSQNGTDVTVTEIPSFLSVEGAIASFERLCAEMASGADPQITQRMRYEKALYQAACKAAIKAGRQYDEEHVKWICDQLFSLPDIKYCPHGRPVCFELSKSAIEKRFLRT